MILEESDISNVKRNINKLNKKVKLIAMKVKSNSTEYHHPEQLIFTVKFVGISILSNICLVFLYKVHSFP